ncbi:MAG: virulence-associated E family protein [Sorangiineae bacterium]|nr:virulence-associated E family protein [Polyangiaceae bacterium]MEB2323878.1 virulence-associated E family protein [Sorangiineae bacterium]
MKIAITRWPNLLDTRGEGVELTWRELVAEFSKRAPFRGDKQHPGWSPTRCEPARRALETVQSVSALCLDYDGGTAIDDAAAAWTGTRALIHTTRKHTPDAHRFRVILPLSREVSPAEYSALWAAVDAKLGGVVDPATKDASRFWYVPGCPLDAEFIAREIEGEPLDVDAWLAPPAPAPTAPKRYADAALRRAVTNVRGAAEGERNRTLNREAYSLAGLVAAGELQELEVRDHLMSAALAAGLPQGEAAKTVDSGFGAGLARPRAVPPSSPKAPAPGVVDDGAWQRGLVYDSKQRPRKCLANVLHILEQHPAWERVLGYDEFNDQIVKLAPAPVREQDRPGTELTGPWLEEDAIRTAAWLSTFTGLDVAPQLVDAAALAGSKRRVVHPVRDWLAGLRWDGTARLDGWLERYLGVAPTPYAAAVGARWLVSAVARVSEPGCKADHMLVLEGDQGIGKSTALRILAGDRWFSDTGIVLGDKDSYQALRGVWLHEFAELSSVRGRDVDRVKAFLSAASDRYRPSYGRVTKEFPRHTVFAGSTNDAAYLSDPTGARRFWPVACGIIDLAALRQDRVQLWAEAAERYHAGASWHLDTAELQATATEVQLERTERDDWVELVEQWLAAPSLPAGDRREAIDPGDGFTTAQVLLGALDFAPDRITAACTKRVGHVLRTLGYEPRRPRSGKRERRYFPAVQVADLVVQVPSGNLDHLNQHETSGGPGGPGGPGTGAHTHERSCGPSANWDSPVHVDHVDHVDHLDHLDADPYEAEERAAIQELA